VSPSQYPQESPEPTLYAAYHWTRSGYSITTDRSALDMVTIHTFLRTSYWARDIPRAVVERSLRNSLCFGLYAEDTQVGFARVVTDRATFAYLADVFVLDEHRGRGLGKWLIECVLDHPDLQGLRRWSLATQDAHGLYRRFGFETPAHPERLMEIVRTNVYSEGRAR
jgi:GNAT superfamily N-acetyltransferase